MGVCKYLSKCQLFSESIDENFANMWIRRYCRGKMHDTCARKVIYDCNHNPPKDMLPNGTLFDVMSTGSKVVKRCDLYKKCKDNAIFFQFEVFKGIWIKGYCEGYMHSQCYRKRMNSQNMEIPAALLPNGTFFEYEEDEEQPISSFDQ
ncbi:MAG: hypothetical protein GY870_05645 [archaeon]|nr:hypothetical protein [archaeon]